MQVGSQQVNGGTGRVKGGLDQLRGGAEGLAFGTSQIADGIEKMMNPMKILQSGLQTAADGSFKLQSGVTQAGQFLQTVSDSNGTPGFYIPEDTLKSNADLQKSMDVYISKDGHLAQFNLVMTQSPYSQAAIASIPGFLQTAHTALTASPIHTGVFFAGGPTASQYDLNQISAQDFTRTAVLILAAIFLLLVVMLRSLLTPLWVIVSLGVTYFVTMGILQWVFVGWFHQTGISWAVPFFSFLLLVALGVDYCIFLMSRYEETLVTGKSPRDAIYQSMKQMGGVIFSAAFIMAGTFGSMTISGVTTLMEIGASVVIGLFLYATLIMGLLVPSGITLIGAAHHWPFIQKQKEQDSEKGTFESSTVKSEQV